MMESPDNASAVFQWPVRVYIEDTDAGGIVFYANYLKFMERARTEMIRRQGVELRRQMGEDVNYVVHSLEIRYHAPARLDDALIVTAEPVATTRTSFSLQQRVLHADTGKLLVQALVRIACVASSTGKPRVLPEALARIMLGANPSMPES